MAKPIVDGIERDLKGSARLIRVDMATKLGRERARRFGVDSIPTLIALDANRSEVYRHTGMPDREAIVGALQ